MVVYGRPQCCFMETKGRKEGEWCWLWWQEGGEGYWLMGGVLYINSVFNTASWKLKWGRSVLMGCVIYMMCFIYE